MRPALTPPRYPRRPAATAAGHRAREPEAAGRPAAPSPGRPAAAPPRFTRSRDGQVRLWDSGSSGPRADPPGVHRVVAVTGIRDLHPDSGPLVRRVITALAQSCEEMRFGGARGVDTLALQAAHATGGNCRLVVVVPGRLHEQPSCARDAAERYAHHIVELRQRLCRDAFLRRNVRLVEGVDLLAAFPDQQGRGGTGHAMREAQRRRIRVQTTIVRKSPVPT